MINKSEVLHIVFGQSTSGSLKISLRELGIENEEKVLCFSDIFSVGPIWKLHGEVGVKQRIDWFRTRFLSEEDYYEKDYGKDFIKTKDIICHVPEETTIFLWAGDSSHEQTGVRYVLYLLNNKRNNIILINTTKAYHEQFKVSNRVYSPLSTGEIPPEKLKSIYEKNKTNNPISIEDRRKFYQEWELIADAQDVLRIWDNGEVHGVDEDFYDLFIINKARKLHNQQKNRDFMKSTRLVGEVIGHLEQYLGDEFIQYRVRHLINNGTFDIEGVPTTMRFYSIKLRS
ncbi:hypothetical protein SRABI96_03715 [Peribacillus sp. Bi96]|uniref:DUF1835 domain-containing protein n=1 Tax=unclassified Peribacillus TaxID=2675266 RepID=UPI001D6A5A3F|nr:DUF1835 domain-containing protein [Peribacillus sp. Bi96]CAH0271863.1 hypothetical protein SRABI96_03715 [Peribacillus sp. Bi96]